MKQRKPIQPDPDDPIVRFISHLQNIYGETYHIFPTPDWWYLAARQRFLSADQGWKLHLPTVPTQAISLLEVVAPLLMERGIQWKVLLTVKHLLRFSSPPSQLPQLGKFITIYPENDQIAITLAALLHEQTQQFCGPVIPSDFRYTSESLVYYRYGGFKTRYFYSPRTALRTHCIITPDGKNIADERTTRQHYPEWAGNPFPTFEQPQSSRKGLFGRSLKVRSVLNQSIKGGVYVVSDGNETFILKEARLGTCPDTLGRDMRDRLTNEFHILSRLAHLQIAPRPVDLFDADNNRYLLMEHLPGQTLRKYIEVQGCMGEHDSTFTRHLCESLIDLVRQCHNAGVILRDLSPNNVLVTRDGCRLIDLELASLVSSTEQPFTGYTHGYVPLGTELMSRDTCSYDIYALGAILCFIITGVNPYLDKRTDILPRLPEILASSTFLKDRQFSDIAENALQLLTTREFNGQSGDIHSSREDLSSHEHDLPFAREEIVEQAKAIAQHLYEQADWEQSEQLWPFISARGSLFHPASFYGGASGIATYMCEVAHVSGNVAYYDYARRIMDWVLMQHPFIPGETPPGLYFGYAGVPWLLAQLAESLAENSYLERAAEIAHQLAALPPAQLDLSHGAAGIGLMYLKLFRQTADRTYLTYAQRLADFLQQQAMLDEQAGAYWQEEGRIMWGLAHGSAGIAYFLLALYSQTHAPALKELLLRVNAALSNAAVPTAHGWGLSWRKDAVDKDAPWTHWCHGASGIGTYLLPAAGILQDPGLEDVAVKAAHAVRLSTGMNLACQCHGLSGNGEYLLQVSRAVKLPEITQAVHQTVRKLYAFRLPIEGVPAFVWNNEAMEPDPDYMTGYCGIYGFLLRFCDATLPRPLFFELEDTMLLQQRWDMIDSAFPVLRGDTLSRGAF